jgi:RNA polymerase sigma-70 factor (ECF subfamily)
MNQPLDRAVLGRAQAGDPAAFRQVYEHCAEGVYRFLHRMLGDAAAAEDALQETFLRVLGALGRFEPDGPAPLVHWVLTIARRVALTREVSGQRARRRDQVVFQAAPPSVPPDEAGELRQALQDALEALPPEQRSVFVLREGEGLSYEEIAAIEGVDLGTVKSRLHRARLALQERLRDRFMANGGPPGERRANG